MRFGEIVESTSTQFVAESLELGWPPALGSLVKVAISEESSLYGVVCFSETASLDPGRRAVRRSSDEVLDLQVYRENPQLEHVLRTEFTSLSVGVVEGEMVLQGLSSRPAPLHYSVSACSSEETTRFTDDLYYFRLLVGGSVLVPAEQLLASHVREAYRARGADEEWLRRAAEEIASLLKQDYDQLMGVLHGIERATRPRSKGESTE
jgi:hypothetical protein